MVLKMRKQYDGIYSLLNGIGLQGSIKNSGNGFLETFGIFINTHLVNGGSVEGDERSVFDDGAWDYIDEIGDKQGIKFLDNEGLNIDYVYFQIDFNEGVGKWATFANDTKKYKNRMITATYYRDKGKNSFTASQFEDTAKNATTTVANFDIKNLTSYIYVGANGKPLQSEKTSGERIFGDWGNSAMVKEFPNWQQEFMGFINNMPQIKGTYFTNFTLEYNGKEEHIFGVIADTTKPEVKVVGTSSFLILVNAKGQAQILWRRSSGSAVRYEKEVKQLAKYGVDVDLVNAYVASLRKTTWKKFKEANTK